MEHDFGSWLPETMQAAGMSRSDLIKAIGNREDGRPKIDQTRISNWIARGVRPRYQSVLLVARALGAPEAEALRAAGYQPDGTLVETAVRRSVVTTPELESSLHTLRENIALDQESHTRALREEFTRIVGDIVESEVKLVLDAIPQPRETPPRETSVYLAPTTPRHAAGPIDDRLAPLTLTRQEAAEYLGVSLPSLDRLAAMGALTSIKLGGRMVRYRRSDIEAFVAAAHAE